VSSVLSISQTRLKQKKKKQRPKSDQLDELEIMVSRLKLKDGHVLVGDKPNQTNEQTSMKKLREAAHEQAKQTFR